MARRAFFADVGVNSVVVSLDTTAVPGVNALAQALSAILRRAGGSGMV